MITTQEPEDWKALQEMVAQILKQCGFAVEIEKTVPVVRGSVKIDVFAEESVKGRKSIILCECKHWQTRVPQTVLHAFRTVVADAGANIGYIIASAGFQSGAYAAAELTNIRLLTWPEFQAEFEESWLEHYLAPFVAEHFDQLMTYTEPLLPRAFYQLTELRRTAFLALKKRYDVFGAMLMMFTPYVRVVGEKMPVLPLRNRLNPDAPSGDLIPAAILDSMGYCEFLAAAQSHGREAMNAFSDVFSDNAPCDDRVEAS